MPAQIEKVIVTTDPLELQHFSPDLRQSYFNLALRWLIGQPQQRRVIRFGQRTAVQLAVGRQRQSGQLDKGPRHHVFRQVGLQVSTHVLRYRCLGVESAGEIGDQTHMARLILTRQNHSLPDARQLVQAIDDLAQFDTETADFHLIVVAAQTFQLAVLQPAAQIAGAVHHRAGLIAERVGNELLCSQVRAIQITQRHTIAANVKLADRSQWRQVLMGIEYIDRRVTDRCTDRYRLGVIGQCSCITGCSEGSRFSGAVRVQQVQARSLGKQRAEARRIGALTAGKQQPKAAECLGDQLHVLIEQCAGQEQHADIAVTQGRAETRRVDQRGVLDHQQLPAVEQGTPDFHGAGIERRVGSKGDAVLLVEVGITVVQHQPGNAAMGNAYAFRGARRTGGIHNVSRCVGRLWQARVMRRLVIKVQLVQIDALHCRANRGGALCQHAFRLAIIEHVMLALGRRVDVQRHIGRCTFADRQLADQQFQ